jgi:spore coat polysaccharide biosynthesis protein SpsF
MTSSRLPGKVLSPLTGQPMLARQIQRVRQSSVHDIVIATTQNVADDPVVNLARTQEVAWFRGNEPDVLQRFVGAARQARADVIVRLTADCPLIDPQVINQVIEELTLDSSQCDYAANVLERTYPRGLDVEALFFDTLLRIDRLAHSTASREHVTLLPRLERPELFLCRNVRDCEDNSDLRWTVDTPADLELVRTLYEALGLADQRVGHRDIIKYVRQHPELTVINIEAATWDPVNRAA